MRGLLDLGNISFYTKPSPSAIPTNDPSELQPFASSFTGIVINVTWAQLQPTPGAVLAEDNPIDQALASVQNYNDVNPDTPLQVKLRMWGELTAPECKRAGGMRHGQSRNRHDLIVRFDIDTITLYPLTIEHEIARERERFLEVVFVKGCIQKTAIANSGVRIEIDLVNIPQQHIAGLSAIARFSETDTTEILSALGDPQLHDVEQTSVALVGRLGGFSASEIEHALQTVFSLANVRADFGNSIPDFVEDLSRSMQADARQELRLTPERQDQFKINLAHLLSDNNLVIASKTVYLKRDYEHTYCRARILTDIRPVYGEDRTMAPSAAIITHVLQLMYHEDRSVKQIHIALDENSIKALKTQLEHAEQKAKSLKALLDTIKVRAVTS